jgi:tetratricopeptide (TPR) repeat protein
MKLYTYILVFFIVNLGFSQPDDTFDNANNAYADEQFEDAIRLYTSILNEGYVSSELYYNLGNAYFKQNDLANAIFHFEKAIQLDPSDPDIRENLEIANTLIVDEVDDVPVSNFKTFLYSITHVMNLNTWAWLSIILSVFFGLFIVFYFRSSSTKAKRVNFSIAFIFLVFAVASLLFGRFQQNLQEEQSFAIIFENQLPVLSEPNPRSDINFELNKGTKVNIGSSFREYTQIELPDGSKGWVKTTAFKKL